MIQTHSASRHRSNTSALTLFDLYLCSDYAGGKYVWIVSTWLCFAVGFPAAVAIFWEMFQHRRVAPLRPYDFFNMNLSVMDAFFLALIPAGMINFLVFQNLVVDAVWSSFYALNLCGRPLLTACMCLDCYLAVVHPITYRARRSLMPRVVMAAIVWSLTIAYGTVLVLYPYLFSAMFVSMPYIAAILIIGLCDYFIFYTLTKSKQGNNNIHPQKQRAVQTLTNSLGVTLISYFPPMLMYICGRSLIGDYETFVCVISIPATITSSVGCCVMLLLDLHNLGKLDRFRCGCCRKT